MSERITHSRILCALAGILVLGMVAAGCRKDEPAKPKQVPPVEEAKTKKIPKIDDVKPEAAVEAMLAKADAVDGKVDKTVSKCAMCALGMDGKAELASEASGYKLHFCNDGCKKTFDKDPTKVILALKIPGD